MIRDISSRCDQQSESGSINKGDKTETKTGDRGTEDR